MEVTVYYLVALASLRLWVLASAVRLAACSDCAMLPSGSYCLSHVCLDCGGAAHPAGLSVGC